MSGKGYTMKEMKTIVDYLTEHKAYSQIRGRKMWIDLQNSKVTNRTWQSLKETFNKRILPDISNPYYKLTMEQISSFKQGYDIESRINNRLQIRSTSQDSNTEGESHKNTGEPDSNRDETGEDLNQSDLRASTETLVLDKYDAPEENQEPGPSRSLRELITYSEPLTPMLQAVLDDFATDDEGSNDEPNMQIVEQPDAATRAVDIDVILIDGSNSDSKQYSKPKESEKTSNKASTSNKKDNQIDEPKSKENVHDKDNNDKSSILHNGSDTTPSKELSVTEVKKNKAQNLSTENKLTQNASNSTTDTFLPDNQEAYKNKEIKTKEQTKANLKVSDAKLGKRRRASSQDNPASNKKRFIESEKQIHSDVDILKKANKKIDLNKLKESVPVVVEGYRDEKSNEAKDQDTAASNEEDVNEIIQIDETSTPEIENPCLKSASLYKEEFSNKCTDSGNNDVEDRKKEENKSIQKGKKAEATKTVTVNSKVNEVVVLKSNSESLSDSNHQPVKRVSDTLRQQRNRNVANVFGFTTGGVNRNRRRKNSLRMSRNSRHSISRNRSYDMNTDSSDWTSDTGPEYVSPPRGRRNKQTRIKPKSARVLSLEEEGGLFVMYGKKIYPVVKDGKIIKNYVSYVTEDEADQEESYWKLKYVEEKKRTAELTKLLNQGKDKSDTDTRVPVIPSTSINIGQVDHISPLQETEKVVSDGAINKATTEEKIVKLKLTNYNEEVQVEGHSSHVNDVLAQVLQLVFPRRRVSDASVSAHVHVEQDVSARVDELENEIFDKIKQKENEHINSDKEEVVTLAKTEATPEKSLDNDTDKEEVVTLAKTEATPDKAVDNDTKSNVNIKRKGRPRKTETMNTAPSPTKKSKLDLEVQEEPPIAIRRTPRTPKNKLDNIEVKENNSPKTRQSTASKSKKVETPVKGNSKEVSKKFPSPTSKSTNKIKKETKNTRLRKSNMYPSHFKIYTSPDNISQNSIESTLGYVDSDPSPTRVTLRKKRKSSITIPIYRTRSQTRKRNASHPYMTDDISSDSSNSFQGPIKTLTFQNSTSSDIYKSDSYQLLMNNKISVRNRNVSQKLDKIDEIVPISQDTAEYMKEQNNEATYNLNEKDSSARKDTISQTNTDSSSNLTMPTSPVLSIVENISISKSMLNNTDDFFFDDDLNGNTTERITLNNFMTPTVDVSMPLMEQECDINTKTHDGIEYHYSLCAPKTSTIVSESFLNKINTVNIQEATSDSINDKLKNLILESTKKKTKKNIIDEKMEQDEDINTNDKKSKSKKRSSTPRKRQRTRKLKLAQNEPCIEEEHMETCSQLSRKSCPPVLQMCEEINNNNESIATIETIIDKPKNRKKKDIIKVKINKPKRKSQENKPDCQDKVNNNQIDSGINETQSSIFLQISEDSVDLIHNHSETCLNAHECMETSVKIIENSTKSIISIDSNSMPSNEECNKDYFRNLSDILAQELYFNDAQDGTQMMKATSDYVSEFKEANATDTVFHTPLGTLSSPNSLITEDLSNDALPKPTRNTKWYLFSEDETSNTNAFEIDRNSSCGANLNEIFPVTCAVPNLSTITEMSKDVDENTRKFSDDTNTRNDVNSQSLFND